MSLPGKSTGKLLVLCLFFLGIYAGLQAQSLKPEKVFSEKRIAEKGYRCALIYHKDGGKKKVSEIYTFDSLGRCTGLLIPQQGILDSQYQRIYEGGVITKFQENKAGRVVKTALEYSHDGQLLRKRNMVSDTLYSVVQYEYDSTGLLSLSYELSVQGDTLALARYRYDHGILKGIEYRGMEISGIEYDKKGNRLISRVFRSAGALLLTRTEFYRRDLLLRSETSSVPGIKVIATTKYRYRMGLLRRIIQPDGSTTRVCYKNQLKTVYGF